MDNTVKFWMDQGFKFAAFILDCIVKELAVTMDLWFRSDHSKKRNVQV